MVICRELKLCLVQLPHTGSTNLGEHLIKNYGGEKLLAKHSYLDQLRVFRPEVFKSYRIVGGVRNPLDDRVSSFFKLKSNHLGLYEGKPAETGLIGGGPYTRRLRRKIVAESLDFNEYFLRHVRLIYANPISILGRRYDFVYRFEEINEGWDRFFKGIGETWIPMPHGNKTAERSSDFLNYYSRSSQVRARRIFGPFMEEWSYEFPDWWASGSSPSYFELKGALLIRRIQWLSRWPTELRTYWSRL